MLLVVIRPGGRLSKNNMLRTGRPDDEDGEDERLNADLTAELHFGGGFIRKDTPTAAPDDDAEGIEPERRRSKKEARSRLLPIQTYLIDHNSPPVCSVVLSWPLSSESAEGGANMCEACGVKACL